MDKHVRETSQKSSTSIKIFYKFASHFSGVFLGVDLCMIVSQ